MDKDLRRKFLLASSAFLAAPLTLFAQPSEKVRRIGVLSTGTPTSFAGQRFRQRLRDSLQHFGYEEGRNLVIEMRYADGKIESLPVLAEELVRLKVELIIAPLNAAVAAAKQATRTIPIVMLSALEPVENGYVESLARPGGNITGTIWTGFESGGKIVQILREAIPGAVRVAMLFNPAGGAETRMPESLRAASSLGMSLQVFPISRVEDIASALDRIAQIRPDALIVLADPNSNLRAREIANFATQKKLVSIGTSSIYVEAGGLIFYGPDISAMYDRTASFVDRILRGAKPGNLPVEGPTKYELVFNSKTAQAIDFKPPQLFLLQVSRTIE